MKLSKNFILAIAAGVIGTGAVTATSLAATSNSNSNYPPIVQKIADKFNLNPADVQSVFQQEHQEKQAQHEQKLKAKLDQAVKDGKLTQDQADKLLAELKSLHEQFKADMKPDRMAERQTFHDQLEQWAKDNGINNLDEILPQLPMGRHHQMM